MAQASWAGADRRQGPRRRAELPRPLWQTPFSVLAAALLGAVAGLALEVSPGSSSEPEPVVAREPVVEYSVDPEQLALARTLRVEAERLAPTARRDGRVHERWLPRLARIQTLREAPDTPAALREELDATVAALASIGIVPMSH